MRLFVAIFPPERVLSDLSWRLGGGEGRHGDGDERHEKGERRRLETAATPRPDTAAARPRPGTRLTPIDQWHLTLRVLGEVPDDGRAGVERALDGVPRIGKISLRLAGGGQFGKGRSTVLWTGVRGDLDALTALHDAVGRALGSETRPFIPHLTVAYADSDDVRAALANYTGPEWTVDELVLVRSNQGYERLRTWPLTG